MHKLRKAIKYWPASLIKKKKVLSKHLKVLSVKSNVPCCFSINTLNIIRWFFSLFIYQPETKCLLFSYFIIYVYKFIYLFRLRWVFVAARKLSLAAASGSYYCGGAWASHCGGFSCCRAQDLCARASVAVAHRLSSCGAQA